MLRIKHLLGPRLLLALAVAYTVLLTWVSVSENKDLPDIPYFPFQDKLAHVVAYLGLATLWGLSWNFYSKPKQFHPYYTVLLLAGLIYGTVIEVLQQQLTTSRTADVLDIVANLFGMLLGAILGQFLFKKVMSVK